MSPTLAAELKAAIMGPKDAGFFADREIKEAEPESELEDFDEEEGVEGCKDLWGKAKRHREALHGLGSVIIFRRELTNGGDLYKERTKGTSSKSSLKQFMQICSMLSGND